MERRVLLRSIVLELVEDQMRNCRQENGQATHPLKKLMTPSIPVSRPSKVGSGDFTLVKEGARRVPVAFGGNEGGGALESGVDEVCQLFKRCGVSPRPGARRFRQEDAKG